jgi:CheY-like chemotaxis protein
MDNPEESLDFAGFCQRAVQLRLLSELELTEARAEVEKVNDLNELLRVLERKSMLTPWQVDRVFKGYTEGFFLGGYRLLYKIKSGSFGRVFRADDPRSGRDVAIKILRRRWTEDARQIEFFMREGRVGLTLKHPNIVEVLAVDQDPASGQYYIVMEFVEGGNLREILAIRKRLSVAESLKIVEDAATGLAYAHSKGVTHRDVKLTNLLISSTQETKLVDFGLAVLYAGDKIKVDRTVDYAGLEKATGVKSGDTRSDIYFLGCILYECLTGRSPLQMTRDRRARMLRDRFEKVQPIRQGEIEAPPSVYGLVETMMSMEPAQRYQTPVQLLDAVRTARRDVEGKGAARADNRDNGRPAGRSVFVVESNPRLQEVLRDRFRELGFRVFLAADPVRALDRFRQQAYEALVVDVGSTGEDGLFIFEHVTTEAARRDIPLAAVAILAEDQQRWADRVPDANRLSYPLTFKTLLHKLENLLAAKAPEAKAP